MRRLLLRNAAISSVTALGAIGFSAPAAFANISNTGSGSSNSVTSSGNVSNSSTSNTNINIDNSAHQTSETGEVDSNGNTTTQPGGRGGGEGAPSVLGSSTTVGGRGASAAVMPEGPVEAGIGSTDGLENKAMIAVGSTALAASGLVFAARRQFHLGS